MIRNLIFDVGGVLILGTFSGYPALISRISGISLDQAAALWSRSETSAINRQEKL